MPWMLPENCAQAGPDESRKLMNASGLASVRIRRPKRSPRVAPRSTRRAAATWNLANIHPQRESVPSMAVYVSLLNVYVNGEHNRATRRLSRFFMRISLFL